MIKSPQEILYNRAKFYVFLAGGITGCSDWQQWLGTELEKECPNLVAVNPRRDNYSPDNDREQIKWEYDALKWSDLASFWFTNETVQPSTLFEYGRWSWVRTKDISLGIQDGYERESDLIIQTELARPDMTIHSTLEGLKWEIVDKYEQWKKERNE